MVDAFLVGSALMSATDTGQAARALVHGHVKLCGLTNDADVALAASSGATHAGLIFVPGTPRAVTASRGSELAKVARNAGLRPVGVFRDSAVADVARIAVDAGLDAVQLHGREDIAGMRAEVPDKVEIWAVCPVNHSAPPGRAGADRTLFDTALNGRSGGTGRPFDWSLIAGREELPNAFLAGGIGPANAGAAAAVGAFGLDVGSAVECAPGIKDPERVAALLAALRPPARSR
jgi:indole-3-glycerol phosphate synthase/phosphoribosylanthranilate isomerase